MLEKEIEMQFSILLVKVFVLVHLMVKNNYLFVVVVVNVEII
jgi:hypothetical protein